MIIIKILIVFICIVSLNALPRYSTSKSISKKKHTEREWEFIDHSNRDNPKVDPKDAPRDDPRDAPRDDPRGSPMNWSCDFSDHTCGIINDPMVGEFFERRKMNDTKIFGKNNVLYLNISSVRSSGARLITKYYEKNGYNSGCLSIDYLYSGTGIHKLVIYQQDQDNHCLWHLINEPPNLIKEWKRTSLTIDLTRGDPRFFIEARFDYRPPNYGEIAISSIKFNYDACLRRDDTNYCKESDDKDEDYDNRDPNELP